MASAEEKALAEAGVELGTSKQDDYTVSEILGQGSFGKVYKALEKSTGREVAVKCLPTDSDAQSVMETLAEIKILQTCKSPYVVNYISAFKSTSGDLHIVMECCEAGSVADLMAIMEITLKEDTIAPICASVLLGLKMLHEKKVYHRDIKAGNILLSQHGNVKLADFGVSTKLQNTMSKRNTMIGTPFWMAPEVISQSFYDGKADIWSLGITAIEMAELNPPLSDQHPMRAIFKIPMNPPPTLSEPTKWTEPFKSFLSKMLVKDTKGRADAEACLKDPFVKRHVMLLKVTKGCSLVVKNLVNECLPKISKYRREMEQKAKEQAEALGSMGHNQGQVKMTSQGTGSAIDNASIQAGTMEDFGTMQDFGTMVVNDATMVVNGNASQEGEEEDYEDATMLVNQMGNDDDEYEDEDTGTVVINSGTVKVKQGSGTVGGSNSKSSPSCLTPHEDALRKANNETDPQKKYILFTKIVKNLEKDMDSLAKMRDSVKGQLSKLLRGGGK
eukprot:g2937.t1